jgi:hypothetical protein
LAVAFPNKIAATSLKPEYSRRMPPENTLLMPNHFKLGKSGIPGNQCGFNAAKQPQKPIFTTEPLVGRGLIGDANCTDGLSGFPAAFPH